MGVAADVVVLLEEGEVVAGAVQEAGDADAGDAGADDGDAGHGEGEGGGGLEGREDGGTEGRRDGIFLFLLSLYLSSGADETG